MALINDAVLTNAPGCQPHTQSHRQRAASPTPRAALARHVVWMYVCSMYGLSLRQSGGFLCVPFSTTPRCSVRSPRHVFQF